MFGGSGNKEKVREGVPSMSSDGSTDEETGSLSGKSMYRETSSRRRPERWLVKESADKEDNISDSVIVRSDCRTERALNTHTICIRSMTYLSQKDVFVE